jgi:hypothetical protein
MVDQEPLPAWLENDLATPKTTEPNVYDPFVPEVIEAGTPAAEGAIIGSSFAGPNLGAMPATQAPQIPGAAAGTGTGAGAGANSTFSSYAGPLAAIAAAEGVRQSQGQLDREYEDRGAFAKMASAPVTGGPPALLEAAGVNSGNAFVKPMTAVAKAEEKLVGQPLDEFFSGNIDKGLAATAGGIVEAPKTFLNTITGGGCIIVTACTHPHAYEVEIAREYRDKFMDADQLRGYYMMAERIVPWLDCNLKKKAIKRWFVDPLVDYGEVTLAKKPGPCRMFSYIVARLFLSLCRVVGKKRESFVRENGEVF